MNFKISMVFYLLHSLFWISFALVWTFSYVNASMLDIEVLVNDKQFYSRHLPAIHSSSSQLTKKIGNMSLSRLRYFRWTFPTSWILNMLFSLDLFRNILAQILSLCFQLCKFLCPSYYLFLFQFWLSFYKALLSVGDTCEFCLLDFQFSFYR